jgi:transcriptional regulator BetI-like protein
MYENEFTDDLSTVVLNVHRRNAEATSRLANDKLTRAYLEAGVRILRHEVDMAHTGTDDDRFLRPLATLTRETVIAEVANGPDELPRHGTVGSFRDRWNYFPEYVADLTRYTLRVYHMKDDQVLAVDAAAALSGEDFTAAIHEICFRRMLVAMNAATSRFRYSAVALAAHDPRLHEAMASVYAGVTDIWERMIVELLSARGLTLRPGVSARDLATMLTAINEGLTARIASDPDSAVLDHERRRGLLGVAALALFAGCIDTGDHASLEELAERIAGVG